MFPEAIPSITGGPAIAGPSSSDTGGVSVGGLTVTQGAPAWFWPVVAVAAVALAIGAMRK